MDGFHEVLFPLRLALSTSGGPVRRTDIVRLSNGLEHRNARWRQARRAYDAGSGIRTIDDLYRIVAFFEARMGQLYGFRFRDPLDAKSCAPGEAISPVDQVIGTGDGSERRFQLVKIYGDTGGEARRTIAKPEAGTVVVAIDGAPLADDQFSVDAATGVVTLDVAPAAGVTVSAGFAFDVPVRFDIDRLDINLTAFRAGRVPSVPLVEVTP